MCKELKFMIELLEAKKKEINERKILEDFIYKKDKDLQKAIAIEEMAELIQAITKILRYGHTAEYLDNLAEEIADVQIVLQELMIIYQNEDEVNVWRDNKIKRIREM